LKLGRRLYREKEVHGVKVLYIDNNKTRVAKKVYLEGRGAWVLLPDGRIGHNDVEFFKWAYVGTQRRDVRAAEALWRLGTIKRAVYDKVKAAQEAHEAKRSRGYAVDEFKTAARKLGIQLTAAQARIVA
jgi:hypothetical protein